MKKWDLTEILYNSREQLKDRERLQMYPISKGIFSEILNIKTRFSTGVLGINESVLQGFLQILWLRDRGCGPVDST